MQYILGIIAILTTVVTGAVIIHKILNRQTSMISFRNLFLFGFFFFYGMATAFICFSDNSGWLYSPNGAGYLPLAILIPLFVIVFVMAGRWGYNRERLGRFIPTLQIRPCTASIFAGIFVCEALAIIGSFPLGDYFTGVIAQSKPGFAACAAGLATYWLVSKRYNPIAWTVFLATFMLSCLLCVSGGTDRRMVLGVFIVVAWIWYYCSLQYKTPKSNFIKIGIAGLAATGFVIIFSNFRNTSENTSIEHRIEQFSQAAKDPLNIKKDTVATVFVQDAPINTLYIIENYPEFHDLKPFHGLYFFIVNPIPRTMFPDKPVGLGYELQQQFGIAANLGPGIIGHGWEEGMWLGVIGYALFFGLMCGILDRKVDAQANNPFFLSVYASSLGNVLGLSRGETALFLVLIVTGWVSTIFVLWLMNALGKSMFAAWPRLTVEADYYMEQAAAQHGYGDDEAYVEGESTFDPVVSAGYGDYQGDHDGHDDSGNQQRYSA